MSVVYVKKEKLERIGMSKVIKTDVVLDIGCGIQPQHVFVPRVHICFEPYIKYIEVLKERLKNNFCSNFIILNGGWEDAIKIFPEKSVDTLFLLDIIEHLEKETSLKLLKQTEKIARRQVVITTTYGFVPQHHPDGNDIWGLGGGRWQEHRSGWYPEDFGNGWDIYISKDFFTHSVYGEKFEKPLGYLWAIKTIDKTGIKFFRLKKIYCVIRRIIKNNFLKVVAFCKDILRPLYRFIMKKLV
ncbi:MAG: class I SAM-dependent methyltransferase [Candidatus Magasanikbacteria bacterium]|nr:class I SAM-dependent methyltransferase [Candidatus Magasanikbacteria bacterium]